MSNTCALVVDFDGTLADTAPGLTSALNRTLAQEGVEPWPLHKVRTLVGGGGRLLLSEIYASLGQPCGEEKLARLTKMFVHHYGILVEAGEGGATLFDGAREVLEKVRGWGMRVALCTNKRSRFTLPLLAALEVESLFDAVVCAGDSPETMKPHPAPLLEALAQVGVAPSHAVMVGDTSADTTCAREAMVPCIVTTFGYAPDIRAIGGTVHVDAWQQIPASLGNLLPQLACPWHQG